MSRCMCFMLLCRYPSHPRAALLLSQGTALPQAPPGLAASPEATATYSFPFCNPLAPFCGLASNFPPQAH